jgi:hypothetical protein
MQGHFSFVQVKHTKTTLRSRSQFVQKNEVAGFFHTNLTDRPKPLCSSASHVSTLIYMDTCVSNSNVAGKGAVK